MHTWSVDVRPSIFIVICIFSREIHLHGSFWGGFHPQGGENWPTRKMLRTLHSRQKTNNYPHLRSPNNIRRDDPRNKCHIHKLPSLKLWIERCVEERAGCNCCFSTAMWCGIVRWRMSFTSRPKPALAAPHSSPTQQPTQARHLLLSIAGGCHQVAPLTSRAEQAASLLDRE